MIVSWQSDVITGGNRRQELGTSKLETRFKLRNIAKSKKNCQECRTVVNLWWWVIYCLFVWRLTARQHRKVNLYRLRKGETDNWQIIWDINQNTSSGSTVAFTGSFKSFYLLSEHHQAVLYLTDLVVAICWVSTIMLDCILTHPYVLLMWVRPHTFLCTMFVTINI